MSRIHAAAAVLAALALVPLAIAQGQPAPREAGKPAAPRAAPKEVASGDPRVCLEFPTNLQVMTCAEKYRPRRHAQ